MYAVIKAGGRQYRVEEGQQLQVDLISGSDDEVTFQPVLLVDGDVVLATPEQLSGVAVAGRVVGQAKGPKITAFNYKPTSNQRRRWGHRQRYSTVEITGISRS
jgi:large subunit ribosomal protein L21